MSAIAGLVYHDGKPVARQFLQAMLLAMAKRGPDANRIWSEGAIGFGHNMLCTTLQSRAEILPFVDLAAGLAITADARIDNRSELAETMACSKLRREDIPDSQLILEAYQYWGTGCAAHLLGDFSFAIYDLKKQRLYCAVDPFSVRPLFYHRSNEQFVFASTISGLLPGRLFPRRIHEIRLANFMVPELQEFDRDSTLLRDVYCLPAAHQLVVEGGHISTSRYWDPAAIEEIMLPGDEDYAGRFLEVFEQAVSCRLRSANGTALALSGGVDSNAVAALAGQLLHNTSGHPLAYSGVSATADPCRETELIRLAINSLQCPSVTFDATCVAPIKEKLIKLLAECCYPPSVSSTFLLCLYHQVAQGGNSILLDGMEADTILNPGLSHLVRRLRQGKISLALREARLLGENTFAGSVKTRALLLPAIRSAMVPAAVRKARNLLRQHFSKPAGSATFGLNEDFANRIDLRAALFQAHQNQGNGLTRTQGQQHAALLKRPFMSQMYYGMDMMSSPFSLELRHPYLDKRLVEYAVGLPLEQKIRHGWGKWILRQSITGAVPAEICWRKGREHVGWKFLRAFYSTLHEELRHALHERQHPIYHMVDISLMQKTYEACQQSGGFSATIRLLEFFAAYCWLTNNGNADEINSAE